MLTMILQRNFAQCLIDSANLLRMSVPDLVYSVTPTSDGLLLRTTPSKLRTLSMLLRNSSYQQFRSLVDIAVVDKLRSGGRFAVNYLFLSMTTNQRAIVQVFVSETSTIPSLAVPFANGQRLFAAAG